MTLSERNIFFKTGIAFSVIFTLLTAGASYFIIPVYSSIMKANPNRPPYFFQNLSGKYLENSYYAVHASLIIAVLFSLVGMILIHYYFERTSTPEILYISLFVFSFSFEIFRLIIPIYIINNYPFFYLLGSARILFFARFFGIFSLFTAGLCAAGFEVQKTRYIILILIISVLLIILGIPIDAQTWDTSLKMVNGYNAMLKVLETAVFLITSVSFLAAAKIRDSKDYIYVGAGAALALAGRSILLGTDNFAGPVLGILFLSFGTYFICSKLHKIHLWL